MFGLRLSRDASDTARLEAFSDGVLAIAITLLVLDIHLSDAHSIGEHLRQFWPHYVAFVASFLNIAVMWANHHDLFRIIERSDRGLQFFNAVLLMTISFLPFPTSVLAEHMRDSNADDRQAALLAYGGTMVVVALAFNGLWRYVKARGLLNEELSDTTVRAIDRAYTVAPLLYAVALPLSFFAWWLSVGLWIGLAVFWQFFSYTAERAPSRG